MRRRAARDHRNEGDAPAPAPHDVRLRQGLSLVVRALDVDVWVHLLDDGLGRLLAEEHDVVYGAQRPDDSRAVALAVDGTPRALVLSHRGIGIEPEHEDVAVRLRLLEVAHMARVQDVEAAVREDDGRARLAQRRAKGCNLIGMYQHFFSSVCARNACGGASASRPRQPATSIRPMPCAAPRSFSPPRRPARRARERAPPRSRSPCRACARRCRSRHC